MKLITKFWLRIICRYRQIIWHYTAIWIGTIRINTNKWNQFQFHKKHCSDIMMSAMASQITGVSIVCLTVCWGAGKKKKENVKAPRHWPPWGESTGDRGTPPPTKCNKAKVMKIFDGWSSEPRSGTSTSNARMAAESGWSLGTRHVDKPGTSLHPSFQWQERNTFRRWLNNTHPTSKHKGQGYEVTIISPVNRKGDEMPIISNRHWFRYYIYTYACI